MITEKNICCIIPYRYLDDYRKNNLFCTTNYIKKCFPSIDILIVEQDKSPTLEDNNIFRTKFIFNDDLFDRGWALNIGIDTSIREYLWLSDGDLIMEKQNLMSSFLLMETFDVVKPFSCRHHLSEDQTKLYWEDGVNELNKADVFQKGNVEPLASGMILTTKSAMKKIGYWFMGFKGWGGEDNSQEIKINRFLSSRMIKFICYHLYHPRTDPKDYINHYNYQNNVDLFYKLNSMTIDQLKDVIKSQQKDCLNPNYYKHD